MKISIIKDSATVETVVEFNQVVDMIRNGDKQEYLFAPSGIITINGRRKNTLIYTGLILLTFETKTDEELDILFQRITEISTTLCCFKNHLGNELNVLIKTDCWDGHHKTGYKQVVEAYQNNLSREVSNLQPDEYILCPIFSDPNIYYNTNSRTFKVDIRTKTEIITDTQFYELYRDEFEQQVRRTEQHTRLSDKTQNNYYAILASNCFEAGIPMVLTLDFIMQSSTLNVSVKSIVKRVYRRSLIKKSKPKEVVFGISFKNFRNYYSGVRLDERLFFEYVIYNSYTKGIPFYCADKKIKAELKINRHRLDKIVEKYTKMGFLVTFMQKAHEKDKFPTTHYKLILYNLPEAAHELMINPTYFLQTVMPLLSQKDNDPTGYFPSS